ncbi:MAG: DUF4136 domain-containing protein [Candidatus Solibacter sp.]|nr:DUF4136 domain-containing protein [Candidatus Solibacter sp.]
MKTSYLVLSLTLLASGSLLPPAFAAKVKAQLAKGVDMANYKTFQWLPPRMLVKTGIDENNPANPILKEAVGKQLANVGLKEVADGADIQIQAYVFTESIPHLEAILFGLGYNFDYGTVVATMGSYNRQGTLFVNLIDSKTKKSTWSAMVTDSLQRTTLMPDQIRAKLEKSATQLFKKYPMKK